MTTTTFVAMIGDHPTASALTLDAAQGQALRAEKRFGSSSECEYRWDARKPGEWRLMSRRVERGGRFSWTTRTVFEVAFTPDEAIPVDGPFPVRVAATTSGADLDVSSFLFKAVFAELIAKADDDPEAVAVELSEMADLLRSAVAQGPNSHARHEFDEAMQRMIKEYANDGLIPLYGAAVGRMAERLSEIATPRPVPAQREAGAA